MTEKDCVVNDALVVLDGKNPSFFSWILQEETDRIKECGLKNAEYVFLKDTPDRPMPQSLLHGRSEITDIQIRLQPDVVVYLN